MNSEKSTSQIAYEAYGQSRDWQTHDGKPMPKWDDLPIEIADAWKAVSIAVLKLVIGNLLTAANDLERVWDSLGSSEEAR